MGYNKAAAEKAWQRWKADEEKQLLSLGVSEDVILRLREADREDFNTERRYGERHAEVDSTYFNWQTADEVPATIRTAQDLLDDIDSEDLLRVLLTVDKLTLQLFVWKMDGYTSADISAKTGIPANTVKVRIWRFMQKIKNTLR